MAMTLKRWSRSANGSQAVAEAVQGAADVKLEQVDRPAVADASTPDRQALVRYGLNPGVVQETVATAIGGEVSRAALRR